MKRITQLNIRITTVLDDKIDGVCDKLNLTRSTLIYKALIYYLASKGCKGLDRLNRLEMARAKTKQDNYSLYLNGNALVTIVRMAKTSLLLTGRIDKEKLKIVIRNYKSLYNLFPNRIKKVLKEEMKAIENLQYDNHLKEYINNWDLVQEFIGIKRGSKRIELK